MGDADRPLGGRALTPPHLPSAVMSIAHVGHAELLVSDLAGSTAFFTDLLGLQVSERAPGRVFLRAWQDWDHHTLLLTESEEPGLDHLGWRVPAKADAEELRAELERTGIATAWVDGAGERGHGDALRFTTPGGLPFELYWEVE